MKRPRIDLFFCVLVCLLAVSCSTRGVNDKYLGATEQRLMTQSLDKLVKMLPESDFMPLRGLPIYLECHFVQKGAMTDFAKNRLELELMAKYQCVIVKDPGASFVILHVFFNAMGTDQDFIGFRTPQMVIPGISGSVGIDLIALDMYHGVSELYYYIINTRETTVTRGKKIHSIIRTDKLSLPFISIPVSTLK